MAKEDLPQSAKDVISELHKLGGQVHALKCIITFAIDKLPNVVRSDTQNALLSYAAQIESDRAAIKSDTLEDEMGKAYMSGQEECYLDIAQWVRELEEKKQGGESQRPQN